MIEQLSAIRMLILDVDGILTDGLIYYIDAEQDARAFHIQDGQGLKMLLTTGIHVAIISGKDSKALRRRVDELGITEFYLGQEEKLTAFNNIKTKYALSDAEIAYMGDDMPDLPILRRVGFAATVVSAPEDIKTHAHYVTKAEGGRGAVREVTDMILKSSHRYQDLLNTYLQ